LTALVEELVENALIYSAAGTPVRVAYDREAEGWGVLSVSDRGRGMTPEQVQGLGTYVPTRRHEQEPGMGLGLAIVRRLVQMYAGKLAFETAPGTGTTVRVRLPAP
jgi:signal transduction histidine kinase